MGESGPSGQPLAAHQTSGRLATTVMAGAPGAVITTEQGGAHHAGSTTFTEDAQTLLSPGALLQLPLPRPLQSETCAPSKPAPEISSVSLASVGAEAQ